MDYIDRIEPAVENLRIWYEKLPDDDDLGYYDEMERIVRFQSKPP